MLYINAEAGAIVMPQRFGIDEWLSTGSSTHASR